MKHNDTYNMYFLQSHLLGLQNKKAPTYHREKDETLRKSLSFYEAFESDMDIAPIITESSFTAHPRKIKLLGPEAENIQAPLATLRESLGRYRSLIDNTPDLIHSVTPQGAFLFVNRAWRDLLGYSQEEIKKLTLFDILGESCREKCRNNINCLRRREKSDCASTEIFLAKNGKKIPVEGRCNIIRQHGKPVTITGIFRDITQRRQAEESLELAYTEMEHRVAVRTQELEEANIALGVIIKRYDQNKKEIEQQILKNLWERISPAVERLKKSGLRDSQERYLELIEAGMIEILSPHSPGIELTLAKLTSTEKTVANLIKQGKNTKEVAAILNIATSTVSKHRENIRKKIGIANKKQPLKKILLTTI